MAKLNTVAIIPVRGGSRGIPRKNARLLAGQPLLAYSIRAAQSARCIDTVYVSTDDAELAEIARRYDAKVLLRPEELTLDNVALDEVIVDAVSRIEDTSQPIDRVVTIQATCPLITPKTIEEACSMQIAEELDTVMTVVDDTYLAWTRDDVSKLVPMYKARLNRQFLSPRYRETGGIVVCSRKILRTGSRFGPNVSVIEVSKTEAIDIDDYFDWWMVERSLGRKRICFHVTGNSTTGPGHAYRVLTLADRLIDHDLWFLTDEGSTLAIELIEKRFYPVKVVQPDQKIRTILNTGCDLVINDVLDTAEPFMQALKKADIPTVNFEDEGPGGNLADRVINAMYDSVFDTGKEKLLMGEKYCCLRDEFYSIEPSKIKAKVENILLIFGGSDSNLLTAKCMQWLDEISGDWSMTAILSSGHKDPDQVRKIAAQVVHRTEVICDTSIVSRYMAGADIAITSAGRTVFELASLGVPMIAIAQNQKETKHSFVRKCPGVSYLGLAEGLNKSDFYDKIKPLLESRSQREGMKDALLSSNLLSGVDTIIDIIESLLKKI